MTIAKVFQSGNSQAIRIPKEFKIHSKEVFIERNSAGELVISENRHPQSLDSVLQLLGSFDDDFVAALEDIHNEKELQEREVL